jgi:hypothetical protein
MTTFPTITPSGRTFTPGEYPHTPFTTISGWQTRVRHSNVMLASQVRLTFTEITEASMLSILSHYQGQLGTFDSFDLPSTVWAGATPSHYQLTNYLWRYIDPPTVADSYYNRYNVELTLETVPPDGAIVDGMYRIVVINLTEGEALTSSGLSKTVTVSFSAVGFRVPGVDATISASFSAGTAAASNGITAAIAATLAAGTVAIANGIDATVAVNFAPGDGTVPNPGADLSITVSFTPGTASEAVDSDYWSDMSVQLYGWESLAYIEWWGN